MCTTPLKCVSTFKATVKDTAHYYKVYLWEDEEALYANTDSEVFDYIGMCCHAPYIVRFDEDNRIHKCPHRMGAIHLVRGKWSLEAVAHECFHAIAHIGSVLQIDPSKNINAEEKLAYIHGEMVSSIYRWLWEVDPPLKYTVIE